MVSFPGLLFYNGQNCIGSFVFLCPMIAKDQISETLPAYIRNVFQITKSVKCNIRMLNQSLYETF
jgi:hypothetical protein